MKILLVLAFSLPLVLGLNNGLGLTPPLGFNTWNHFGCDINETTIMRAADAIISLKLKDVGYKYVNIDDCWMGPLRGPNKELMPDPKRFPNGIKNLADYMHVRGLKLGIYSSAGTKTCQGLPASLNYEELDAKTWARWEVDYLKYDNCYRDYQSAKARYTKMRDALNKTQRPIYYSICNWGEEDVWDWGKKVGNSWRTTGDIKDSFDSMRSIFIKNAKLAAYAGPGGWNDPDMLEVGNGGMTTAEYRTHFSLWCIVKSPLLIGCDLSKIKPEDLEILSNKELIAVSQDKLGKQGSCVKFCTEEDYSGKARHAQFWKGELENKEFALFCVNWNDKIAHLV